MSDPIQPPILKAGRHLPSIVLFAVTTLGILAADLLTKYLAFAHVAEHPIVLSRDANDGSTVVQQRVDGELETLQPIVPDEPASALRDHRGVTVIPRLFALKLTINTGAVFGLGKGAQWLFVVVTVAAVAFILFVFGRTPARARVMQVCQALILGGALGNLYDRLLYNGVRDMCYLFPGVKLPLGLHWPGGADELYPWIFNIADAALVIGVLVLLVATWVAEKNRAATGADAVKQAA